MKPLFGAEGRAAIAALMARPRVLLAFDFDGTLAPIVARPDHARIPLPVARRMQALNERWPVAVITGRSVADVSARLGFDPTFVVGNHGIEDPQGPPPQHWATALGPLREHLETHAERLRALGVQVEDKAFSIALHYRLATSEAQALKAIADVVEGVTDGLHAGYGKCVVNLVPRGAPDKGDAVLALARRCHADAGLFVGDDDNDEAAFARAPADWVTVRMAPDHLRSRARYYVDGTPHLPAVLQMLLDCAKPP